jgi:hypothetical protein
MLKTVLEVMLLVLLIYVTVGALFAALYHWRGMVRLDPSAAGASWFFRSIITPGIILFWPLLARQWGRAAVPNRTLIDETISPETLRRLHQWAWYLMVILVPLILATALRVRPSARTLPAFPTGLESPSHP